MADVVDIGAGKSGDELLVVLNALSHPQRMRILGALAEGPRHVSQLARDVRLSRPLLYMHLQRLQTAGLVSGTSELSPDGRARKLIRAEPFALSLTLEALAAAAKTVTTTSATKE